MLNTRWRWHFAVFCHMHQIQHSIILWSHPAIKIRILFHVDERQLNHVLSYFTYVSPSPYSGGECGSCGTTERCLGSREKTEKSSSVWCRGVARVTGSSRHLGNCNTGNKQNICMMATLILLTS